MASNGQDISAALRRRVETELERGEKPLAWFETDLNNRLHYQLGLVVLTDRHLISVEPVSPSVTVTQQTRPEELAIRSWRVTPDVRLEAREQGGVGTLQLVDAHSQLWHWRYTVGKAPGAHRLVAQLENVHQRDADAALLSPRPGTICPSCGTALSAGEIVCPACAPAPAPPATQSMLRLVRFARPHVRYILVGLVLTVAATAVALVPPYLTKPLVDKILFPFHAGQAVDVRLARWYLAGLGIAAVVAWLLGWARTYVLAWVSERVSADLRNQTFAHLQKLSLEFFGGKRTGDLMSRVGTDSDRICYFLSVHLVDFVSDVMLFLLTAALLLSLDFRLASLTLLPLPLLAWMIHRVRNTLRGGFQAAARAWAEMTNVLADTIPGIRVVKAFAQENREIRRFRASNSVVVRANDRVNRTWSFFGPMVVLLTDLGLLIVWTFGVWRVFQHAITPGELTAFVALISRFYGRLESLSRMVEPTQRAAASAQRIFEILDRQPSVAEAKNPIRLETMRGEIELRNIQFRYGNRPVIRGIDLKIRPGEMIGLVGPSGAGKTTLANLICRFYDVADGQILVDGHDVRSVSVEDYRKRIGIVLQEPFLFYGTIAENVAYGRPDAPREEIVAAAKAARAHEFILRLPDGYDSLVGERGQSLSGGERQRISIARALLIDPKILILDEATSSVDTETEREIQLALENLIRGRTTIAIAHRLSTLQRADRLVVVEHGRVSEIGSHEELLRSPGTYARLHQAQLEMAHGVGI